MRMEHTYGIFDYEADSIVELVRCHSPLAEILKSKCPARGTAMMVAFSDDGRAFYVACNGYPLHMSIDHEIANPPPWWRECVNEATESTWYWREWHSFDDAGNLAMKISGWQADGSRWSGELQCAPDHRDYAFWKWVLCQSGCTSDLLEEKEIAVLRARFAAIG